MQNFDYTLSSDLLEPKARKPMPFPLENFDEDIAIVYSKIKDISIKLNAAETNPINHTIARKKKLKSLKYKTNSCIKLIEEISNTCQQLWY